MSLKSTQSRYGSVALTIHWLSAILIVIALATGFRTASTVDPAAKAQLLTIHVPIAILVALLTVARLLWWLFMDQKPDPVAGAPNWQQSSAKVVHWLFYVVILGMAASGAGMFILSDAGAIVFGNETSPLPEFENYKPRIPHGIGARFMVLLLVAHIGAALYHHFIKRDGLLARMWFKGTDQ